MKQLTFGMRSLAVLATSSALAFSAPASWAVSPSGSGQRTASYPGRPGAASLHQLGAASSTGDSGAFLDLPTTVVAPAPGRMTPEETPAAVRSRRCAGDVACFLVCTRAHESDSGDANGNGLFDAGYGAVSADGSFRGAYQFMRSTWNSTARGVGRDDLVGVDPAASAPADQDFLAGALYARAGNSPWGGRC